ncbi:MAG: Gfo/Idh/MocA family protein [Candidatus Rariloculaceae bacterium]
MINSAIVGLGWWGQTLVEGVSGQSDKIRFTAGVTRSSSDTAREFADAHGFALRTSLDDVLADDSVDALVLVTPNSLHADQVVAAAEAGKHVFCEKPLALTQADAQRAVDAADKAGVVVAVGYNRRLHPEMLQLKKRIESDELGVILHVESTMAFPNALYLEPGQWRANKEEAPCGGLMPMGVHAIDGMIDLCGAIDEVYAQSFRRIIKVDADDTTSILFRMSEGTSGYLGTMTATGGTFSFQVFGSKGYVRLEGKTHEAGASSEERRAQLFENCIFKPVKGPAETWQAEPFDLTRAALEAFAEASMGERPHPIPPTELVHGVAVTEAIVKSASTNRPEKIQA